MGLAQRAHAADVLRVSFCGWGYMLFVGAFAVEAPGLVRRAVCSCALAWVNVSA